MVVTHDFYPMDSTICMPIIAFSCVLVKWNVIFFNLLFFLVKLLKLQKISDWNELSSITGQWKLFRIYWQWILIEQTSLYTVVYRAFLYNPTNLKVPKKALWVPLVPLLLFKFPITGVKKNRPHGSEPPVAGTGHPGLYSGWRILPDQAGYFSQAQ